MLFKSLRPSISGFSGSVRVGCAAARLVPWPAPAGRTRREHTRYWRSEVPSVESAGLNEPLQGPRSQGRNNRLIGLMGLIIYPPTLCSRQVLGCPQAHFSSAFQHRVLIRVSAAIHVLNTQRRPLIGKPLRAGALARWSPCSLAPLRPQVAIKTRLGSPLAIRCQNGCQNDSKQKPAQNSQQALRACHQHSLGLSLLARLE